MARVCQLTDDLKYYLCMEPVDMRGKMVNNKVNDMFEQQQNTGKSTSLAEKYANAVGQLSDANDRAAHAEHDLQVERITRQDLIDEEVARRVAEAEERIRKELEAQLADKTKELEERNKALDKRESDVDKKAETIAQNVSEQVRQQMSAAKPVSRKLH